MSNKESNRRENAEKKSDEHSSDDKIFPKIARIARNNTTKNYEDQCRNRKSIGRPQELYQIFRLFEA